MGLGRWPARRASAGVLLAGVIVGACDGPARPAGGGAAIAPPAATGAAEAGAVPMRRDGFEGESLAEFWRPGDKGSGRYEAGAVVLTDERARSGVSSARITVREGDVAQRGDSGQETERAELDSGKHALLGRDAWVGFSFLVPPGFPIVERRLVLSQWKQSELEGSPIVAQRFVGGRHYLTIRNLGTLGRWRRTLDLPAVEPGRWHDMVFHVRFSRGADGLVEVWMDGERVVRESGRTASAEGEEEFYHKVGLYRDRMAEPMTVYIDNYTLGESFEDVDPAGFEGRE